MRTPGFNELTKYFESVGWPLQALERPDGTAIYALRNCSLREQFESLSDLWRLWRSYAARALALKQIEDDLYSALPHTPVQQRIAFVNEFWDYLHEIEGTFGDVMGRYVVGATRRRLPPDWKNRVANVVREGRALDSIIAVVVRAIRDTGGETFQELKRLEKLRPTDGFALDIQVEYAWARNPKKAPPCPTPPLSRCERLSDTCWHSCLALPARRGKRP